MRQSLFVICVSIGALSLAVPRPASAQGNSNGNANGGQSEVQRGFAIAPVPLNLAGKNQALVGIGSYLVNGLMDCAGCHQVDQYLPGGDPFQGQPTKINQATYLGGGAPFGPFVSRNLTPDQDGLPAGLTYDQFVQTIRMGVDAKANPPDLLQVMPWPAYRHATDQALRAVYEYLRSIPCLEGGPEAPANRCGP